MVLDVETKYFNSNRAQWIEDGHEDEWAVVRQVELLGFYPSLAEAYAAGVECFGSGIEFLAKRVTPDDPVETIQRVYWGTGGQTAVQEAGK